MNERMMDELNSLDRDALMGRMARELPYISGELGLTAGDVILRAGLDMKRLSMVISGKRKMKWSEYLSILFVLWDNEEGRGIIEESGLFPDALKRAMSINRHAHGEQGGE